MCLKYRKRWMKIRKKHPDIDKKYLRCLKDFYFFYLTHMTVSVLSNIPTPLGTWLVPSTGACGPMRQRYSSFSSMKKFIHIYNRISKCTRNSEMKCSQSQASPLLPVCNLFFSLFFTVSYTLYICVA